MHTSKHPYSKLLSLGLVSLASANPCDIYADGGTPCVAAHALTRALYEAYNGPLYQLLRGDGATKDVTPVCAGGIANTDIQDSFCNGDTCAISIIYDQSGNSNHLNHAPKGGAATGPEAGGFDYMTGAYGGPVNLSGKRVYGMFGTSFTGYRNDETTGIATGDEPEGIYGVFDGTHYNNHCCFDYGNAEVSNNDTGDGHMEALYFGTGDGWSGTGAGSGPWVMADLENSLYSGPNFGQNDNNPTIIADFVTGIVKGEPGHWALRGGDATKPTLTSLYDGPRPSGYSPMSKEGAIILGIGGDNSDGGEGTFYEGAMTSGYPTDETEDKIQADIVAAGYSQANFNTNSPWQAGQTVQLQVTTPGYTDRFLSHNGTGVSTQAVTGEIRAWVIRAGLAFSGCWSFESADTPGSFLRHYNYQIQLDANDGSVLYAHDATYCTEPGVNGQGTTIRSYSYPNRYFRHKDGLVYIASNGGPRDSDTQWSFINDISWGVSSAN